MFPVRFRELISIAVLGEPLNLQERKELLNFLLEFNTQEELLNKPVFTYKTSYGAVFNINKDLYDDICKILETGKEFNATAGRFYNSQKIAAIKEIRLRLSCGLKEAKDICESKGFPDYGQYVH